MTRCPQILRPVDEMPSSTSSPLLPDSCVEKFRKLDALSTDKFSAIAVQSRLCPGWHNSVGPGWSGNKLQLNTIQYNTIQYNTIQYNTIQYILFENFYLLAPLANTRSQQCAMNPSLFQGVRTCKNTNRMYITVRSNREKLSHMRGTLTPG